MAKRMEGEPGWSLISGRGRGGREKKETYGGKGKVPVWVCPKYGVDVVWGGEEGRGPGEKGKVHRERGGGGSDCCVGLLNLTEKGKKLASFKMGGGGGGSTEGRGGRKRSGFSVVFLST